MSSVAKSVWAAGTTAPTLVGRRAELLALKRAYDEVVRGHSRLVLVSGMAGIGKSALVQRALDAMRDAGAHVIVAECAEQDVSRAFGPLIHVADPGLRDAVQPRADARMPFLDAPDRGRMFAAIAERLRVISRERATVLVVEDLQWADGDTLDLLPYLCRRAADLPLLMVATMRIEDTGSVHLPDRIADLRRRAAVQLDLAPLTPHEVGSLVQALLLPGGRADQRVRSFVIEHAGGNPLFVEEIVRSLVEHGWLALSDGIYGLARPITDAVVPTSIGASVRARLRPIPAAERRILASAAVIGQRFAFGLLVEITGSSRADVIRALHAGIDAQLIEEPEDAVPAHAFRHALFRDALLEELIVEERADIHHAVGSALEAAVPEDQRRSIAHELAIHFDAGGDTKRALRYHLLAARVAHVSTWPRVGQFSPNPGAAHLERALALAPADHPDRSEMVLAYAWAQDNPARRTSLIEKSLELAQLAGDQRGIAVSTLLAGVWRARLGAPAGDDAGIREGIRLLEPFGPSADLADGYFQLARIAMLDGRSDAVALSERAVELARQLDLPALLAQSLITLGPALLTADRPEGLAVTREGLALAREHGTPGHIGRGLANLWVGLISSGAPDEDVRAVERAIAIEAPGGNLITAAFLDGDWDRTLELADELFATSFHPDLAYIRMARGGPAGSVAAILREHERNEGFLLGRGMSLASETLYLAGEHRAALTTAPYFARAIDRGMKGPLISTGAMALLAAAISVPDDASIDEWIERCSRRETVEPSTAEGRRQYARGERAIREGHMGEALDAFARSAIALERRGATLLARTLPRLRRAELLAPTDVVTAQKELAAVMAMWRAVGAKWYLGRLRRWADEHGLRGWTVSARRGPQLTPREMEVAQQVANGLTNKEIAAALGITERTAETHVQRILTKLDLRGRAQLAAWVSGGSGTART